jgi:hypothetical protein
MNAAKKPKVSHAIAFGAWMLFQRQPEKYSFDPGIAPLAVYAGTTATAGRRFLITR